MLRNVIGPVLARSPTCQRSGLEMFNYDETVVFETLGGHFRLPGTGVPPVCMGEAGHWQQNLQKFFSIVRRFACLDVGFELRSTDLGALMSMLTYSAIAWDSRGSVDNRQQRTIVNMLAGGKSEHTSLFRSVSWFVESYIIVHPFLKLFCMNKFPSCTDC